MKDTYYFSHDYNPRGDEKIQGLLFEMGWEGYGLYWGLVELLYQNDGYLQLECKRIAFELRTDCDKIEKLINDFNLFMINDNMFTSKSVLHRLKKRKEKTLQTRKAAEIRWGKGKQNDADAMQTESESNAIKVKESILKEIKVKENKFKEQFQPFLKKYPKEMLNEFFRYWSEPNKSKTKLRWEMETTWDIGRRLSRWASNDSKFEKKTESKIDGRPMTQEEMRKLQAEKR